MFGVKGPPGFLKKADHSDGQDSDHIFREKTHQRACRHPRVRRSRGCKILPADGSVVETAAE